MRREPGKPIHSGPPVPVDRRDGNTKGEMGPNSVNILYNQEHLTTTPQFRENYDKIAWDGAPAICQNWPCPHRWDAICKVRQGGKPENCRHYKRQN